MQPTGDPNQRDVDSARSLWEEMAVRARALHCPEHFAQPWRVSVLGETPERYRLYVSGCCPRLGEAVNQLIRSDPRISGPR